MAGLFQVLWGTDEGTFAKPAVLEGTDGEPLIIPAGKKQVTDKICTRPTAVDLDGDGRLDIVSGNFKGTFAVFAGAGRGRFAPEPKWLEANGSKLRVDAHSDPFFIDWDADGDLDLISGASGGGVFLFLNQGSAKAPKFGKRQELLQAPGRQSGTQFGEDHLTGPQRGTRVWVDDINGDGRFDILIGDNTSISNPAEGLDEETARARLQEWQKKSTELSRAMFKAKDRKAAQNTYREHSKARQKIITTESTGFVWVMYQKQPVGNR